MYSFAILKQKLLDQQARQKALLIQRQALEQQIAALTAANDQYESENNELAVLAGSPTPVVEDDEVPPEPTDQEELVVELPIKKKVTVYQRKVTPQSEIDRLTAIVSNPDNL